MALSGVAKVDQLVADPGAAPIAAGEADRVAVGVVQDLLLGHGFTQLPGVLGVGRGVFGQKTSAAVTSFQEAQGLPATGAVDGPTLAALIAVPATRPIASLAYLTLVLEVAFLGMTRLMSLTSQFEGVGRFTARNRNTDRAGLSFGLIQWAQRPGRLTELLTAFQQRQAAAFAAAFGDGDAGLAARLLQHCAPPSFGVDKIGQTTHPEFDLVSEPWLGRFEAAGLDRDLQRVQVDLAVSDFQSSFQKLQGYAPALASERAVAFMLDLANQFGDTGARRIYEEVCQPGMSESDLLSAIADESVARVQAQFGDGPETDSTSSRREAFRTTPLLTDAPFVPV
jgi:peptidoglycan hydrolase-like protein with peptidoglycan-binding domain